MSLPDHRPAQCRDGGRVSADWVGQFQRLGVHLRIVRPIAKAEDVEIVAVLCVIRRVIGCELVD